KHKGVIQKQIINGHTVILLAGSDRWGTKAAVEYFKTLEDIPEEPIFVEWKDGEAIKINKP
ncbi:MAG TPA: S-layer protein, partial [Methanothermococcus okinawensis]|nr:S-layer protein [Methanothermococcus okinawensis]